MSAEESGGGEPREQRRRLLVLAALNVVVFGVEAIAAVSIGSFSAFFESLELMEGGLSLAILAVTPHWSMWVRYLVTGCAALSGAAAVSVAAYLLWPRGAPFTAMSALIWLVVAAASIIVNAVTFLALRSFRGKEHGTERLGYLGARADVWSGVAVMMAAVATYLLRSRWPDLYASLIVILIHVITLGQMAGHSAKRGK